MKLRIIAVLGLLLIAGCCKPGGKWCKIEQKVEIDSYADCTYCVETILWIKSWTDPYGDIEKMYFWCNIRKADVDSVKVRQYRLIEPYYLRVKQCIDRGIDPCEQKPPAVSW